MNTGIFANLITDSLFSTINQYYQIPTFIFSLKGSGTLWLLEDGCACWKAPRVSSLGSCRAGGGGAEGGRAVPTSKWPALCHPAQQNQWASMRNKEVFQDYTGLTATFGFQWSHMDPTGHI